MTQYPNSVDTCLRTCTTDSKSNIDTTQRHRTTWDSSLTDGIKRNCCLTLSARYHSHFFLYKITADSLIPPPTGLPLCPSYRMAGQGRSDDHHGAKTLSAAAQRRGADRWTCVAYQVARLS